MGEPPKHCMALCAGVSLRSLGDEFYTTYNLIAACATGVSKIENVTTSQMGTHYSAVHS
jgi:hypothetical protein